MSKRILESIDDIASVRCKIVQVRDNCFSESMICVVYAGNDIFYGGHVNPHHQVILITEMIVERGLSDAAIRNNVLNGDSVHVFRLG